MDQAKVEIIVGNSKICYVAPKIEQNVYIDIDNKDVKQHRSKNTHQYESQTVTA
jgi:hypothetical protein